MGVSGEKESNREWKTMIIYISSGLLIDLVLRPYRWQTGERTLNFTYTDTHSEFLLLEIYFSRDSSGN